MNDRSPSTSRQTSTSSDQAGSHARWWWSVLGGCALSLPFAYYLGQGAFLPFLLILFFFTLFGVVIGAGVYRMAAGARPYRKSAIILGVSVMVIVCWSAALISEAHGFPSTMTTKASDDWRPRLPKEYVGRVDEFRADLGKRIADHLASHFPPGGTIGYVRWALESSVLPKYDFMVQGRDNSLLRRDIKNIQGRFGFGFRLVMSLGLLWFGIGSQTLPLRLREQPNPRVLSFSSHKPAAGITAPNRLSTDAAPEHDPPADGDSATTSADHKPLSSQSNAP